MFEPFILKSLWLVAVLSGVPLLICSASSFFIAVLQAATQIQEQTITYLVRFICVSVLVFFFAGWVAQELISFWRELLSSLVLFGRM